MDKYRDILENDPLFYSQTFTNREAFLWIISNAKDHGISVTVNLLSAKWKWHTSKVKRFLNKLHTENWICKEIRSGNLYLTISDQLVASNRPVQRHSDTRFHDDREPCSNQKRTDLEWIADIRADNRPDKTLILREIEANSELQASQFQGKEEKKKRSKKRKEEDFIKEKITPMGFKKEKMLFDSFQNLDLKNSASPSADSPKPCKVPMHLVQVSDVEQWAQANLQVDLDLNWELGKFQDYWLTARKKPPKDGLAAFRKAAEIKTKKPRR